MGLSARSGRSPLRGDRPEGPRAGPYAHASDPGRHAVSLAPQAQESPPIPDCDMGTRAVFLDFGGTLVHSQEDMRPLFEEAARRCDAELPWTEFLQANDEEWESLWPRAPEFLGKVPSFADTVHERSLRRVGMDHKIPDMVQAIREEALSPRWHAPFPEAAEVLGELKRRGCGPHLISNNVDYLPLVLRNLGWGEAFGTVTYSQEVGAMKPDPRIFRTALERAHVAASEAMVVGDSLRSDVEGARRVGISSVWIDRKDLAPRPGVTRIRNLREVLALL